MSACEKERCMLLLILLLLLLCLYWRKTEMKRAPHTAKFTLYQMFVKAVPLSQLSVCVSPSSRLFCPLSVSARMRVSLKRY